MTKIVVEEEVGTPLAVVYHGGELGKAVAAILRREKLRVSAVSGLTAAIPVWERPNYVFFFASSRDDPLVINEQWIEATELAKEEKGKTILILIGRQEKQEELFGADKTIRILGGIKEDPGWLTETAGRIVAGGLQENEEILIIGRSQRSDKSRPDGLVGHRTRSIEETLVNLSPRRPVKADKKSVISLVALFLIFLLISPFIWLGFSTVAGFSAVLGSTEALRQNETVKAKWLATKGVNYFADAKETTRLTAMVWPVFGGKDFTERYFSFLSFGASGADLVSRASDLLPRGQTLIKGILEKSTQADLATEIPAIRLELSPIDQDLGFIEGQFSSLLTERMTNFLSFFGLSRLRLHDLQEEVSQTRQTVLDLDQLLGVAQEIVPLTKGQSKSYLVVFQNSAELRPTGGFIGSFALVHFDSGSFSGYKIYDVYFADGQLRGQIAPPDEILHFLGQTSWFMRDANWAPDWPLTAKRLEWFLEKETGITVDGVVGVSLGAVQKLLVATGPLNLSGEGEAITAKNFFEKAEFASEINFFPGSDQKPRYLGAVADGLFLKISSEKNLDWLGLGRAVKQAVAQKDIMFYFNSPVVQGIMQDKGWTGSVAALGCGDTKTNCLMLVEANLGANKANYFVKRSLRVDSVIGKAGEVDTTVIVKYRNDSPSTSWPGGVYKNYLRFLVPEGSTLENIDLGDKREATISGVLTAEVLKEVLPEQFLVFKNLEQALRENGTVKTAGVAFGAFFDVPVGEEKTVTFRYRPSYKLDFMNTQLNYQFVFLRQPGTGADAVDFSLDYPSFLTVDWGEKPPGREFSVLALPQKLVYNTELSEDREIKINFRRQ